MRKVYGRHVALSGVSCGLRAGEITVLMGPNGAGKSTLLGLLSTLRRPSGGTLRFGEHDAVEFGGELRSQVGLVAHAALLYRDLSCRENLIFFARIYGVPDPARVADEWLARLGMTEAADRPVRHLSRGMTQRISVARALLSNPSLLLLDEPFTGLDFTAVEVLRDQLREARAAGKIVVVVTHDLEAMDGLADHVLVLVKGRLVAEHRSPGLSAGELDRRYRGALRSAGLLGANAPAAESASPESALPESADDPVQVAPGAASEPHPPDARAASASPAYAPSPLRAILDVLLKDLRVEWRSREIVYTMGLFSVLMVAVFSFALSREGQPLTEVAGGLLWIAIAFAGTLGLGRVFERERESDTLQALLLSPLPRGSLYVGKLLGVLVYLALTELVTVPLIAVLFNLELPSLGLFAALLLGGTLGYAIVGTLFAGSLMRSGGREVLLGILTYPIAMPLLVAGAKGTAALLASPADLPTVFVWLKLVSVFDLLFVVLSLWTFGPLVSGE